MIHRTGLSQAANTGWTKRTVPFERLKIHKKRGQNLFEFWPRFVCYRVRLLRVRSVCLEVLVEGFAADAEFPGQAGLLLPRASPPPQLARLLGPECLPASTVGPAGPGQGDPFALAFPDRGPFELGEAPMTERIRFAMGESSPVKTRCSLRNSIHPSSSASAPATGGHPGSGRAGPCCARPAGTPE
jgi:hypothetical protein